MTDNKDIKPKYEIGQEVFYLEVFDRIAHLRDRESFVCLEAGKIIKDYGDGCYDVDKAYSTHINQKHLFTKEEALKRFKEWVEGK